MTPAAGAMLEREEELEALSGRIERAANGDGSLIVVEGVAGIGKTTLLSAATAMAEERGMIVLRARGGILEQQLEYGVVRQLVERHVMRAEPERRAELLAGPAAPAATVLGLAEPRGDGGPGYDPSVDILNGLHWLTANIAERAPVLMLIDDAQWADVASQRAGGYMARRLEGLPIAMLLGVRTDEASPEAAVLSAQLQTNDPLYVRPRPLSVDATTAILADAFGGREIPAELSAACLAASGGNPFFLTELAAEVAGAHDAPGEVPLASVAESGPVAVRRSILMRLGRLGEDPLRLARALATLGGEGEVRQAAAIAGLDEADAGRAADRLRRGHLAAGERPLRLVHPLVRAAVAEEMPASERADGHRRAFAALAAEGATDDALLPHAIASAPIGSPEVVGLLRRSADRALRTGNPATAAELLGRALAEPPTDDERGAVLAELGRAEVRAGGFAEGLAHLDQALAVVGDREARAEVHRDRAFAAFAGTGMADARELVGDALADLGGEGDALQLEADLALLAWLSGAESDPGLDRHRDVAGTTAAERTVLGILAQAEQSRGEDPAAVVDLAERARGGGRLIAEDTSEALSWYLAVYALLTVEALEPARASIEQALADAKRRGSAFAHAGALGARAVLALNEGRPRDAEADARDAAAGPIPPTMAPVNSAFLVMALADQGDLEGAAAELAAGGIDSGPGGPTVLRFVPWARARLRELEGDLAGVREAVAPLAADDEAGGPMRALAWRALLARAVARGGGGEEAAALAAEHLRWAERWDRPAALGIARRSHAVAGPAEERVERLEEAVATLAVSPARVERSRAELDLGIALLRGGRRNDGSAALERALEVALEQGARGVARAAAEELEIAGAPARRLSFDELTPSERRVAELAAGGATNREIADRLFVTPKTVENHLTRAYAKLGVGSRRDLDAVL
ncbi:MAG: AAA family ATPase [Solirubrobacterales bacterium]